MPTTPLGLRLRPEPRTTFGVIAKRAGWRRFCCFCCPSHLTKPNSVSRWSRALTQLRNAERHNHLPCGAVAFYALHLELDPFPKMTAVTEAGCEKFPRLLRLSASTHNSSARIISMVVCLQFRKGCPLQRCYGLLQRAIPRAE